MKVSFAAVVLLCLACVARGDWTLMKSDLGKQGKINVNEWTKEGLSFTDESGKVVTMAMREAGELVNDRPEGKSTAGWRMKLRNGDMLLGEPGAMKGQNVVFTVAELGAIEVPIKVMGVLATKDAKGTAAAGADKDTLRLKNGDVLEGIFASMDETKVQMQGDQGNTDVELERVERLTLGGAAVGRGIPALGWRVRFSTGTVLTTTSLTWTINDITIKDPAGLERKCSADQIASVEVVGGGLMWLTELDPAKEEATSYFGTKWPMVMNKNVVGTALKVNNHVYTRGIGVHTRSVLTYDLDGTFRTLTMKCGMDDTAAPYGQANVAVVADGKVLWEAKGIKAGQAMGALTLPVTGVKHLELRAEPASRMDVLGRVDWVEAALHRP